MKLIAKDLCASDERGLIRTGRLVTHLAVVDFRDDCMADCEESQELVYDLALAARVPADIYKRILASSNEGTHVRERAPGFLVIITVTASALVDDICIRYTADGAESEFHFVSCERTGLVAENVFDLS